MCLTGLTGFVRAPPARQLSKNRGGRSRKIPTGWTGRLLLLGALGGVQGAVGWWMVASGLTGTMLDVASYRVEQGLETHYAKDGRITSTHAYENGQLHGSTTRYYPDGTVKIRSEYLNGQRHGLDLQYYENGQLMSQSTYVNGLIDGEAPYYSREGKLEGKVLYVMGRKVDHVRY